MAGHVPAARKSTQDRPPPITTALPYKPATATARILLAEDNLINQKVAIRLLQTIGYRADVVINGLEVLKALETNASYDLILMDCQMPVQLDGYETTQHIRALKIWKRLRIIAMTA